jgi:hypothetical protein
VALFGAEQYPDSVVVLGAEAHYAEVEYGWLELGSTISNDELAGKVTNNLQLFCS